MPTKTNYWYDCDLPTLSDFTTYEISFTFDPYDKYMGVPIPKRVIFNNPATIVYWTDGVKTVVQAQNEPFNKEHGLAMAISKRFFGNKGNYNDIFKEWCGND